MARALSMQRLLILLLFALLQPTSALLGRKGNKDNKKEAAKEKEKKAEEPTRDWFSQQQHQRPGRRRLETMSVDEKEVLSRLLQEQREQDPLKSLPLLEEEDPDHVTRRVAGKRGLFFHPVADALVPPDSAILGKEREAVEDIGGESVGTNGGGGIFHRLAKRRLQRGQLGELEGIDA